MTSIYSPVSSYGWQLRLDWELLSQSVPANTSTLRLSLYLFAATVPAANVHWDPSMNGFYRLTGDAAVTRYQYSYSAVGWYLLAERELTLDHAADGRLSAELAAEWDRGGISATYIPQHLTLSGQITLPQLPRASGLTAPDFVIGEPGTVTLTRADPSYTHRLTYAFCGETGVACESSDQPVIPWTPPASLALLLPDSDSGTLTLTLETFSDGVSVGTSTAQVRLSVAESVRPTLGQLTVARDNSGTAASAVAAWVQGYSRAIVTFSGAAAAPGTEIVSYSVTAAGQTVTGNPARTPTLTEAQTVLTCTVTDSRGRVSAPQTVTVTLLPYFAPTLSAPALYRSTDGEPDESGSGLTACASLSFAPLGGANSCTLTAQFRPHGGTWSTPVSVTPDTPQTVTDQLSPQVAYEARLTAADSLGSRAVFTAEIPTDSVTLHLREGGRGAAFGKYAEQDGLLDIAWGVRVGGSLTKADLPGSRAMFAQSFTLPGNGTRTAVYDADTLSGFVMSSGWANIGFGSLHYVSGCVNGSYTTLTQLWAHVNAPEITFTQDAPRITFRNRTATDINVTFLLTFGRITAWE